MRVVSMVTLPASVRPQTLHVNPGSLAQSRASAATWTSACEALSLGRHSDRVRAFRCCRCCGRCWNLGNFSQSTYLCPPDLVEHHCLCHLPWPPSPEAFLSATTALCPKAASASPLNPAQNLAISRPHDSLHLMGLCTFTSKSDSLDPTQVHSTSVAVFDSPGGDLQGCGHDLHPRGVGTT